MAIFLREKIPHVPLFVRSPSNCSGIIMYTCPSDFTRARDFEHGILEKGFNYEPSIHRKQISPMHDSVP